MRCVNYPGYTAKPLPDFCVDLVPLWLLIRFCPHLSSDFFDRSCYSHRCAKPLHLCYLHLLREDTWQHLTAMEPQNKKDTGHTTPPTTRSDQGLCWCPPFVFSLSRPSLILLLSGGGDLGHGEKATVNSMASQTQIGDAEFKQGEITHHI